MSNDDIYILNIHARKLARTHTHTHTVITISGVIMNERSSIQYFEHLTPLQRHLSN